MKTYFTSCIKALCHISSVSHSVWEVPSEMRASIKTISVLVFVCGLGIFHTNAAPMSDNFNKMVTTQTFYNIIFFLSFENFCRTCSRLVSWESEATPLRTPFFKRAYKISHPPRLLVSWVDLPSFAISSKIWPNFSNKVFFSWSYEKVVLTKNVRLTYYSSMKKKNSERFGCFLT